MYPDLCLSYWPKLNLWPGRPSIAPGVPALPAVPGMMVSLSLWTPLSKNVTLEESEVRYHPSFYLSFHLRLLFQQMAWPLRIFSWQCHVYDIWTSSHSEFYIKFSIQQVSVMSSTFSPRRSIWATLVTGKGLGSVFLRSKLQLIRAKASPGTEPSE